MNAKTQTQTTKAPKANKAAGNTPANKAAVKPKAFSLIAFIVAGIEARKTSAFYKSAFAYHKKAKTAFPRERNNAARLALTKEACDAVFSMHDKMILASGNKDAQAMLDAYMSKAK